MSLTDMAQETEQGGGLDAFMESVKDLMPGPEAALPAEPSSGLSAALDAAGIEHTRTPKTDTATPSPEPETATEAVEGAEAATATEAAQEADDGPDPLLEAMAPRQTREENIRATQGIRERAVALGVPEGVAKALANNTPRQEAEEYLAQIAQQAQTMGAGQPLVATGAAPTQGAAPVAPVAEVQERLNEALGEEAATVVTGEVGSLRAELAELKSLVQTSHYNSARASAETQIQQVASEISGECPNLVRNGTIDPAVKSYAAALWQSGPHAGDLAAAMKAAYRLAHGAQATPQRQTSDPALKSVDSPVAAPGGGAQVIPQSEFTQGFMMISQQFANDPAERDKRLDAYTRQVQAHNAKLQR